MNLHASSLGLIAIVTAGWALASAADVPPAAGTPPLTIVTASLLGTSGDDDLEGAAAGPDGTIYVVGNLAIAGQALTDAVQAHGFGMAQSDPHCGCGFVAQLSADGKHLLHCAEFAPGIAQFTTVQCDAHGVYVGGYASAGLAALLADHPGLMRTYPLDDELRGHAAEVAAGKPDPLAGRPGLGRYGAPCVLRLSADLAALDAGTYLEGWQQVWDKTRVAKLGKDMHGGFHEFFWQPTGLVLLPGGDVAVSHDGGYFRPLTDADRQLAQGDQKFLDRLAFYDTCDWVSRLSPDLATRTWRQPIRTPSSTNAKQVKHGWPAASYGNPRTHRLRSDGAGNLLVCGWSASETSNEPWWSPFLWKLDAASGEPLWKAYDYDPMAGGGNRMGGEVSDTAVTSVAADEHGSLLVTLLADGGNTVMLHSPSGDWSRFEGPLRGDEFMVKLVHWWGLAQRVDPGTRHGVAAARVGPWGWGTDLAPLPDGGVLMTGRCNSAFPTSTDAWWSSQGDANPTAFLRVLSSDFTQRFSTVIPDVVPFELVRLGAHRCILVGRSESGRAPCREAMIASGRGGSDGFLMVLDWAP